jgi:hypothetical protein
MYYSTEYVSHAPLLSIRVLFLTNVINFLFAYSYDRPGLLVVGLSPKIGSPGLLLAPLWRRRFVVSGNHCGSNVPVSQPSSTGRTTGQVADDCRRICRQEAPWVPSSAQEIANFVLHTTYMGTENSSELTTSRAKRLGYTIGSYHLTIKIDLMVEAVIKVFSMTTGRTPQFSVHGGTNAEDLALQNIQARLRMVTAYLYAALPWVRGRRASYSFWVVRTSTKGCGDT